MAVQFPGVTVKEKNIRPGVEEKYYGRSPIHDVKPR